jgi:hypothetical protein
MKNDLVCQLNFDRKNMGCVAAHCASDVSRRLSFFNKSAHLFADLPVTKAIFSGI